jgi:hypothetical protein
MQSTGNYIQASSAHMFQAASLCIPSSTLFLGLDVKWMPQILVVSI